MRRALLIALMLVAVSAVADQIGKRGGPSGGNGSGGLRTTVSPSAAPVNGSDECNTGDQWFRTSTGRAYFCDDGATDHWTEVTAA